MYNHDFRHLCCAKLQNPTRDYFASRTLTATSLCLRARLGKEGSQGCLLACLLAYKAHLVYSCLQL